MQFFEVFPSNFFTLFASPNRAIYAEALLVLHRQYRQETRLKKQELVSRLVANMENRMLELQYEEGGDSQTTFDIEAGGEINLSGRAHFLLRRFQETGWLEPEPDVSSFEECYVIPGYAGKLLNLFADILQGRTVEYNGFVYSTYSTLKTADHDRDEYIFDALKHAHIATTQLWTSLRELLDNIRLYHQRLRKQVEIKEILVEHFDRFRMLISDRIYHPLKTFDSVPRFKQRIVGILKSWLRDPVLLKEIARAAVRRGEHHDEKEVLSMVIAMIGEIIDVYDKLDDILAQIDLKNAAYTRASVERMQYYLNTERDIRGKLVEVIKALPEKGSPEKSPSIGAASADLPLYTGAFFDDGSLYTEPQRREEHQPTALRSRLSATEAEFRVELEDFQRRLQHAYSHRKVIDFIMGLLEGKTSLTTAEIELVCSEDFIKLLLAVVKIGDPGLPYRVEFRDGYLYVNGYRLPELVFYRERKGKVAADVGR